jgi:hypothetical protein
VHQVVSAPARSTESYQINFHPVYFKNAVEIIFYKNLNLFFNYNYFLMFLYPFDMSLLKIFLKNKKNIILIHF